MSLQDYIGERLKANVDFLDAQIAQCIRDRDALLKAWETWDLDELEVLGYISSYERAKIVKEHETIEKLTK